MKKITKLILLFVFLYIFSACSTIRKTQLQYVPQIEKEYIAKTDTTIIKDSIFINRYQRNDTVFLTNEKYKYITRIKNDTLQVKDTLTVVKEVQVPQKYVPSYYHHINTAFWILVTLILLLLGRRLYKIIRNV